MTRFLLQFWPTARGAAGYTRRGWRKERMVKLVRACPHAAHLRVCYHACCLLYAFVVPLPAALYGCYLERNLRVYLCTCSNTECARFACSTTPFFSPTWCLITRACHEWETSANWACPSRCRWKSTFRHADLQLDEFLYITILVNFPTSIAHAQHIRLRRQIKSDNMALV